MDGRFVGEVAPLRDLDRIDLADQVGDRDVGGRELLGVAVLAREPGDRELITHLRLARPAGGTDRREGIAVDLATRDRRNRLVEEFHESADDPGLRLAALAENHHVVPGEDRVLDVGNDRLVVAQNAREDALASRHLAEQVLPQLVAHPARPDARPPELAQGGRCRHQALRRNANRPRGPFADTTSRFARAVAYSSPPAAAMP